jgi:hypothetical protein
MESGVSQQRSYSDNHQGGADLRSPVASDEPRDQTGWVTQTIVATFDGDDRAHDGGDRQ